MECHFDINWEAGKFYKVACFIILYSETKHSMLTFSRRSESGGSAKKSKQEKKNKQNSSGVAALFFISGPSSSPLSEGATPMVAMSFVKGSFQ